MIGIAAGEPFDSDKLGPVIRWAIEEDSLKSSG